MNGDRFSRWIDADKRLDNCKCGSRPRFAHDSETGDSYVFCYCGNAIPIQADMIGAIVAWNKMIRGFL